MVSRCEVSTPTSLPYSLRKLRIISPAPASKTSVRVSSTTISAAVHRRARTPPDPIRPPSFSTSWTFVLETCSAGARPNSTPVARQTAAKKAKTVQSIEKTIQYGLPTSCVAASNHRIPKCASGRLRRPLRNASKTLSTSNWRTTRHRVAPRDTRTLTSCRRPDLAKPSRCRTGPAPLR